MITRRRKMKKNEKITNAEIAKIKKDAAVEVEKNMKVFKEWVEKIFPIGAKVSFLGREMYVYDLWEPTTRWASAHDFSVICAWWDGDVVRKIILTRKEVGTDKVRLLFPVYLNYKLEKIRKEKEHKKYCYGD